MGNFHDAVSSLLDAFTHGISIINTRKARDTEEGSNSTRDIAEDRLKRSLKTNKSHVKRAFLKEKKRFGTGYATGDEEARSSLSAILSRLNAGFVSVIERFTKGRSSSNDYQVLLNLSNASRIEAMRTFEQLSSRLSKSSLEMLPVKHNSTPRRKRNTSRPKKPSSSVNTQSNKGHSKSTLEPSILGPATNGGWVRPKGQRRTSSSSTSSKSASSRPRNDKSPTLVTPRKLSSTQVNDLTPRPTQPAKIENRKSIMSFASDSTKLGEIPEHKRAPNSMFAITQFYPLEPYSEPQKQRSRFMRLFRR